MYVEQQIEDYLFFSLILHYRLPLCYLLSVLKYSGSFPIAITTVGLSLPPNLTSSKGHSQTTTPDRPHNTDID